MRAEIRRSFTDASTRVHCTLSCQHPPPTHTKYIKGSRMRAEIRRSFTTRATSNLGTAHRAYHPQLPPSAS